MALTQIVSWWWHAHKVFWLHGLPQAIFWSVFFWLLFYWFISHMWSFNILITSDSCQTCVKCQILYATAGCRCACVNMNGMNAHRFQCQYKAILKILGYIWANISRRIKHVPRHQHWLKWFCLPYYSIGGLLQVENSFHLK